MSETIELPQNLTIHHIEEHFNTLSEQLNAAGDAVVLDGSKVETIDTSGLQALLVGVKSSLQNGKTIAWENPTEILASSAAKIGIAKALQL